MVISSEEIAEHPGQLFDRKIKIWRPDVFCAIQILYETKNAPRVRAAVSDNTAIIESTADCEIVSMKDWWLGIREEWADGKVILVIHDGSMENDEVGVWMDINLVVPFFRIKLDEPNLTLGNLKNITAWHSFNNLGT